MATKGNIRSFRYSDRVAEMLERQQGNSLNEKFENLVLYCYDAVPKVKQQLDNYEKLVADQRRKYSDLIAQMREVDNLIQTLEQLKHYGASAAKKAEKIARLEM